MNLREPDEAFRTWMDSVATTLSGGIAVSSSLAQRLQLTEEDADTFKVDADAGRRRAPCLR